MTKEKELAEMIGIPQNHGVNIDSLQSFLDIIDKLEHMNNAGFKGENLWYRGLPNIEFTLLPKVFRGQLFDTGNQDEIYANEKEIFQCFCREAKSYIHNASNDDYLSWLSYAQHFNAPTRLLDFTSNPLVALYFATNDLVSKDACVWIINIAKYNSEIIKIAKKYIDKKDVTIAYLKDNLLNTVFGDLKEENPYANLMPISINPFYIDNRMSAQCSKFLLWGNVPFCLERSLQHKDYVDLDNYNEDSFVLRIKISSKDKKRILEQLDKVGINEKTLFPGLDGVGKYINSHFKIANKFKRYRDTK